MYSTFPNLRAGSILAVGLLGLASPPAALAADRTTVSCSVAIDYLRNGVLVEQYRQDFVAEPDAPYVDDISTSTRFKRFTADVVRQGGETIVTFDWFSDVGVFHSVGVGSQLTLRGGGRKEESVSGSQSFSASSGTSPAAVGGNHNTLYTLACRRL